MFAAGTLDSIFRQRGLLCFHRQLLLGMLSRCWAALTGHPRRLRELSEVRPVKKAGCRFIGVKIVPVRQIQGTEGRRGDFDADFNPLGDQTIERWLRVFIAWQRGTALPAVELIRVGQVYFVRDGHHRVSVARAMGQEYIEAAVTAYER